MPGNEEVIGASPWIRDQVGAVLPRHLGANFRAGYIPLPLASWRLIASNEIPVLASHAGDLASDSAPSLKRVNTSTDKKQRIAWAAASVIEIANDFQIPPDLDTSFPLTFNMRAAMAGATDIPVVSVGLFADVGDTNFGGNTAAVTGTGVATYSVIAASSDLGAFPSSVSISLTPAAHGTDILYVYSTWITYTKRA